jgi:hypothetical protein
MPDARSAGPSLEAVHLTGYRCFARTETLRLRPLTVLFGRNNAGKSAVLRAIASLGRSVREEAVSAWDMGDADGPGRGAPFKNVLWRGASRAPFFELGLSWSLPRLGDARPSGAVDRIRVGEGESTQPTPFVWGLAVETPSIATPWHELPGRWEYDFADDEAYADGAGGRRRIPREPRRRLALPPAAG